jgi:hypothetical protein
VIGTGRGVLKLFGFKNPVKLQNFLQGWVLDRDWPYYPCARSQNNHRRNENDLDLLFQDLRRDDRDVECGAGQGLAGGLSGGVPLSSLRMRCIASDDSSRIDGIA